MNIDFILNRFYENKGLPFIIWNGHQLSYGNLLNNIDVAQEFINDNGIKSGVPISITGDFTPNTIAILLALVRNDNIIVPFNAPKATSHIIKHKISGIQKNIIIDIITDDYQIETIDQPDQSNSYYELLIKEKTAGLVLFTSGTSGTPKAAVHNFGKLLEIFRSPRKALRTINFLLFDHWGGLNTVFNTVSSCGLVLPLKNRTPEAVCKVIEQYEVELLPASPSFINLLLLSGIYKNYDLSSLKLISYGTEPMPQSTLIRAKKVFPNIRFKQTYGLIELGVLRSKSKSEDSLWVKLGGEGYKLRVVNNMLEIKAESAMLGYLNAPSPFTDDGYFITGDMVEKDGDYYKILGRKSELINVGGEKVYPQEVESVILEINDILDVTVYPQKHALIGNIVCAKIIVKDLKDRKALIKKVKQYCKNRLEPFKVPIKISVEENHLHNERFKKKRV